MRAINVKEVSRITSFSITHIREMVSRGDFPKSYKISDKRIVWNEDEVMEWLREKFNTETELNRSS